MRLTLAKNEWEAGEFLWYKLEIKNVGRRRFSFYDKAWFNSGMLAANSKPRHPGYESHPPLTRLIAVDPEGKPVYSMSVPFGYHGELKMWTDDCGAKDCSSLGNVSLAPGETITTAPSKAAPIRYKRNGMDDPGDVRIPPGYESQAPPAGDRSEHREWRKIAESVWRDGTGRLGPRSENARTIPLPGYTILDRYDFYKPGRHELKVVLAVCGGDIKNAAEVRAQNPLLVPHECSSWFKVSRNLYFTSNTVVFNVIPAKQSFQKSGKPLSAATRQVVLKHESSLERAIRSADSRSARPK